MQSLMRGCSTGFVGVDRNERLTAVTGAVLIVLLAALGVTILSDRPAHLVARADRDASHPARPLEARQHRLAVPPLLQPLAGVHATAARPSCRCGCSLRSSFVSTLVVFGTGVALIVVGPAGGILVGLHKASFIVWLFATAVHVLAHLRRLLPPARPVPGAVARARPARGVACRGRRSRRGDRPLRRLVGALVRRPATAATASGR